jgi:hypothetical protein
MASIKVIKCEDWMETQRYEFVDLHKMKVACKKKTFRQIVESFHINTMVTSYNVHFVVYNTSRKWVTPSVV